MPPVETFDLYQTAVLWRKAGRTRDNEPVLGPAEEVDCRWVWKRVESVGPDGQPIALDGQVALECDVPDGSVMWLGELADFDPAATDNRLMTVTTVSGTPDVKGRLTRHGYGLMRFRGTLPTVRED